MSGIDLLLDEIDGHCDQLQYRGIEANFMIDCARMVEHKLPSTASAGLSACRRYLTGDGSMQLIKAAILDCWADEERGKWGSPSDAPNLSANRAILCILKRLEGDESDPAELLGFFLNLINNVEIHEEEQEALLRKYFAICLAGS